MKDRHAKLLQLIRFTNERGEHISGKILSEQLGVSTRTVRNDISYLNNHYLVDAHIYSNNRLGYRIEGKMQDFNSTVYFEFNQRAFFIIQLLIKSQEWKVNQDIADQLFVSAQTISSDLIKISESIGRQQLSLSLKTEAFCGIRFNGNEIDKRQLLASFVKKEFSTREELVHELSYLFSSYFTREEIESVIYNFDTVIAEFEVRMETEKWSSLLVSLLIQKQRIPNFSIPSNEIQVRSINKTSKEFVFASKLIQKISSPNEAEILPEIEFLALQLIGLNVFQTLYASNLPMAQDMGFEVKESLFTLGKRYGYDFLNDQKLVDGLENHLKRVICPLKHHIYTTNKYLTYIKSEYIQAYQMAIVFSKLISQKFAVPMVENEVGYIALHIEASLERLNDLSTKVALVSEYQDITVTLRKQKIEKNFPNIQIMGTYAKTEIHEIPENVSLVVSTFPLEMKFRHTMTVNTFLNADDLMRIKQNITFGIIQNRVDEHQFIYLNESSKESFLEQMVEHFNLQQYHKSILDRESLSSTDIGNDIALPHPLFSSEEEQSSIYIGINHAKLNWGERTVRLVFLLILSEKDELRYEYIYREIYQLMRNEFKIQQLMRTDSYDQFIDILN
ncbi:putative licABCH operon regulator [Paraliobacillus ryukyuensis]|uniref:Transcriptional antiterminator n=1 Tax=Paraliobacillus ryukyuensis TaxID=200904 RepID=A0A366EE88_9BACI|nr:PTS sugar transporter subunit IIA [Paraliobacillus ryukyuensis]RBP00628.1 transcriptional antiterminator [Paraliobacillus ryukyuensis]